jgi:hypothetical protein
MKLFYLIFIKLFLILSAFSVNAQNEPVVKLSANLKLSKSEMMHDHVISTDKYHIVTSSKLRWGSRYPKLFLNKFNPQFNIVKSVEFEADRKNIYGLDAMNIGQQVYLLTMEKDSKNDKLKYFLVPFDENLNAGKPKKIADFGFEKRSDEPDFKVVYSQDSTLTAFIFYLDNNNKKDKFEMFISVMNKNSEEVWSKKVRMTKFQNVVEFLSATVNNEGNVYLIMKEYEGEKAKESKRVEKGGDKVDKPAYEMMIYKLNGATEDKKDIKIELKNNFIANCNIKVLQNGDVNVLGLYSSSKKLLVNGVFSIKIHGGTDSIYQTTKKDFTKEDLDILADEDVTSKHKDEEGIGSKFDFLDFHTRKDGSSTVVMEENYSVTYTRSRAGGGVTTTTYYYTNEAIVINLSPGGEISNIAILPKKQSFADINLFNSSVVLFTEEGLHLVHLEDKDNLKKPYGKKVSRTSSFKDCVVVDIFLSNDGKATRTTLLTREDTKALFLPKISKKISSNEIFFVAMSAGLFSANDQRVGIIQY